MTILCIGNKNELYIDPVNLNCYGLVLKNAINYQSVDLKDVNHIVVKRYIDKTFKIIQASGFSIERGLFCNCY